MQLTAQLNSDLAAERGFDKPPYDGFPTSSTVAQSLRPLPQFAATRSNAPAITYLWAPLGKTWYDSLQIKATKRLSHGLSFTSAFTFQKELALGVEQEGGSRFALAAAVNDVFNRPMNKYISGLSRPFVWVTAFNYTFPKWGLNRVLSWIVRDWKFGAVLEYSSGQPICVPTAHF